jgi:hypothetical protein
VQEVDQRAGPDGPGHDGVSVAEVEVGDEGAGDALELAASPASVAVGAVEVGDEQNEPTVGTGRSSHGSP